MPLGIKASSTEEDKKSLADVPRRHVKGSQFGTVFCSFEISRAVTYSLGPAPGLSVLHQETEGGRSSRVPR